MNSERKLFPLPLSSVAAKSVKTAEQFTPSTGVGGRQTAMKNVASQSRANVKPSSMPAQSQSRPTNVVSEKIRSAMVDRIAAKGVKDRLVLDAMFQIKRHDFIEAGLSPQAYVDASLPIGCGQTISQPYIVARMLELLRNRNDNSKLGKVLEIGTGCGYQAAVLSKICEQVYSIERIKVLHDLARSNLRPMRIANIRLHYGDGMIGLKEIAPFDGIVLAAAGIHVPQDLLEQLTVGGRLVAPVGVNKQSLIVYERISEYEWSNSLIEDCHFVPLKPGVADK